MSTDEAMRNETMANWDDRVLPPIPPPDLRFGSAPGNTMSPAWAAHMLGLWFQAQGQKITFADAIRSTAVHFMVEGDT